MLIASSRHTHWLSNSWLVADKVGGEAVLIDSGGPSAEIDGFIADNQLTLRHVLCTHHHYDHVANNDHYYRAYKCDICAHANESNLIDGDVIELNDKQVLNCGGLEISCLHIPGHTSGQLAFYINQQALFTGDTLFAGSVGGTMGPDNTSFEQLQHSILEVLFSLPPQTIVYPGHMQATTLGDEFENNPFVRVWRGLEKCLAQDCTVNGRHSKLLLRAADYDGGTKCWVQDENGLMNIVAGSQVIS
ncbi:MAG: MBL fold metallo-hydrolase [Planctomycetes bacterium]|nr:MBL fold metallo-hydrolase [Planctomycetota bacterium]